MEMSKNWLVVVLGVMVGLGGSALAATDSSKTNTCPTNLHQDKNGYWTSNDLPGWKSQLPTKKGITLTSKDFGGAVYSPQKRRIACVYKDPDGKYIALLSNIYHPFAEDHLTGKGWEFNHQYKDYICGKPKSDLNDCEFAIK